MDNDIAALEKSLNETAQRVYSLWIGFLTFEAYLVLTTGSISHKALLLETPVKPPALGVELPLVSFFAVAPVLFIIAHFYLLINLKFLSERAGEYKNAFKHQQIGNESVLQSLHARVDSFIFLQLQFGPSRLRSPFFVFTLSAIAVTTACVAPIVFLVHVFTTFLPYQDGQLSTYLRILILIDLFIIILFWGPIRCATRQLDPFLALKELAFSLVVPIIILVIWFFVARFTWYYMILASLLILVAWLLSKMRLSNSIHTAKHLYVFVFGSRALARTSIIFVVLFSVGVACFPGEWVYEYRLTPFTGILFEHEYSLFSNRLYLPDEILVDPERIKNQPTSLSLKKRNFRNAIFDGADLRSVTFSDANLTGASMKSARLLDSFFTGAHLELANLFMSQLDGAHMDKATLVGADLSDTSLIGVTFQNANLSAAKLRGATLYGADFQNALLSGASLSDANAQGAIFTQADLEGVYFRKSKLQWAAIAGATSFRGALFDGVTLMCNQAWNFDDQSNYLVGSYVEGFTFDKSQEALAAAKSGLMRNSRQSNSQRNYLAFLNKPNSLRDYLAFFLNGLNTKACQFTSNEAILWEKNKKRTENVSKEERSRCLAGALTNLACCGNIDCSTESEPGSLFIGDAIVRNGFLEPDHLFYPSLSYASLSV